MTARNPLGVEHDEIAAARDRHGLMDLEDAARDVGRIDGDLEGSRIGNIARRRYPARLW